jgi:hypothetical protein
MLCHLHHVGSVAKAIRVLPVRLLRPSLLHLLFDLFLFL